MKRIFFTKPPKIQLLYKKTKYPLQGRKAAIRSVLWASPPLLRALILRLSAVITPKKSLLLIYLNCTIPAYSPSVFSQETKDNEDLKPVANIASCSILIDRVTADESALIYRQKLPTPECGRAYDQESR